MRALLRDLCLESCVFRALVLRSIISSKQPSVKTHMVVHDYVWRQNAGKSGLNSKKLCFVARRSVQQSLRESVIHTLRHTRISTPQFRSHILSTITLPIHTFFTLISHLPISRWTGLGVDLMTSEATDSHCNAFAFHSVSKPAKGMCRYWHSTGKQNGVNKQSGN